MYTERLNDKEKNERNKDGLLTRGLKDINTKTHTQEESQEKSAWNNRQANNWTDIGTKGL